MQKLLTFFQLKNIKILYIESAKTVNEMTLNELVKLTFASVELLELSLHYENTPIQIYRKFHLQKLKIFK